MLLASAAPRHHLFFSTRLIRRGLSTLVNNQHIYVLNHPTQSEQHLLTFLPTVPPNADLAIASTSQVPPTPDSTAENPHFLELLHTTIAEHAHNDPNTIAQATAFASQGGAGLGSGGALFQRSRSRGTNTPDKRIRRGVTDTVSSSTPHRTSGHGTTPSSLGSKPAGQTDSGAGGASAQGGMGSGGAHGFIHVSDGRNPPDWGRVAWPEDIFGSLEVDAEGNFVKDDAEGQGSAFPGRYQRSGTYRVVTRDGVLGLSAYMRERLVERLKDLEARLGEQKST